MQGGSGEEREVAMGPDGLKSDFFKDRTKRVHSQDSVPSSTGTRLFQSILIKMLLVPPSIMAEMVLNCVSDHFHALVNKAANE